jgi:hypothetical protein
MVLGIVFFVFMYFCYVLYNNPDLVINEIEAGRGKGGFVQLGNILIHYYILTGILLWTLFMFDTMRVKVNKYTETACGKFKFICSFLIYLLLYFSYWKFSIDGVFKNYHIDDVPVWQNITAGLIVLFLVMSANVVMLRIFRGSYTVRYSFKKNDVIIVPVE